MDQVGSIGRCGKNRRKMLQPASGLSKELPDVVELAASLDGPQFLVLEDLRAERARRGRLERTPRCKSVFDVLDRTEVFSGITQNFITETRSSLSEFFT